MQNILLWVFTLIYEYKAKYYKVNVNFVCKRIEAVNKTNFVIFFIFRNVTSGLCYCLFLNCEKGFLNL